MTQGLKLISWDELEAYADANPSEWFIPEIMQAYTFNVLCGWPKAGKSSFTRDLVSCSINGGDFLNGLKVKQGSVLYVTTEQGKTVIRDEMRKFGVPIEVLRERFILSRCNPSTPEEFVQNLQVSLKERPDIKLIVLDTLRDFLPGVNLDAGETSEHLTRFVETCEEHRVTILALHHFNKLGKTLLASVSGSQAISGKADTIMGIWGNEDRPRYFEATSRNHNHFPKTRLFIDQTTKKVSLGGSGKEFMDESEGNEGKVKGEAKRLLEFIQDNDGVTQSEMKDELGYTLSKLSKYLKQIDQHIRLEGNGGRHSPKTYYAKSNSDIEIAEEPVAA